MAASRQCAKVISAPGTFSRNEQISSAPLFCAKAVGGFVRQTPITKSECHRMPTPCTRGHHQRVNNTKRHAPLPIGRTARIAFEIEAMRAECCKAANAVVNTKPLDEKELDECARLDEALAHAHRILKSVVRNVMLSRINRRSRQKK